MTSGDLNIDLNDKIIEVVSNVLIESNRMFFRVIISILLFEFKDVVILTPPPHFVILGILKCEGCWECHPGAE